MTEEYVEEEEYITDENDPDGVEKVTSDAYPIPNEETVEFDPVLGTVEAQTAFYTRHDEIMTKKLVKALKNGDFRK